MIYEKVFDTTEECLEAIRSKDVPKLRAAAASMGLQCVYCILHDMPTNAKDYAWYAAYYAHLVIDAESTKKHDPGCTEYGSAESCDYCSQSAAVN